MNATEFELYEDRDGLYRMRSRVDGHLVAKDLTAEDALALFVLGKERAELLDALTNLAELFPDNMEDDGSGKPGWNLRARSSVRIARALIAKLSQE